jgi:hypothetical protein
LQKKGLDVTGIDASPIAVDICLKRGLKNCLLRSIESVDSTMGTFDSIIMFGNNFGLFKSRSGAIRMLRRFDKILSPEGRILAVTLNPLMTSEDYHLAYHQSNRESGRMPGQVRIRFRFKNFAGDWFEYLFVTPDELHSIVEKTPFKVEEIISTGSPIYGMELRKKKAGIRNNK